MFFLKQLRFRKMVSNNKEGGKSKSFFYPEISGRAQHDQHDRWLRHCIYTLASVLASFPCCYKLLVKSVFSTILRTKLLPLLSCFPNMFHTCLSCWFEISVVFRKWKSLLITALGRYTARETERWTPTWYYVTETTYTILNITIVFSTIEYLMDHQHITDITFLENF